jgi:hypothetical protein
MLHITVGLFLIALGIWGVFDEWYYVIDCLKGGSAALMTVCGMFAMLAGLAPRPRSDENNATSHSSGEGDHE